MCLYPKIIKNPKYKANGKNGGNVPVPIDRRTMAVAIGCQECIECKRQKARAWQVRLQEEIRTDTKGKFVTLTFSEESRLTLEWEVRAEKGTISNYELNNEIATLAVRRYLERWRKKHGKSIKHWLITELGTTGTERIHLHGIIFTDNVKDIQNIWKYGYVYIGEYVNTDTIGYITKYMTKTDITHKEYTPKILTSPGIGREYTTREDVKRNKFNDKGETKETYKTRDGNEMAMPAYWRNKIYTDEEREKLWIKKLDEQKRWVLGQEIDISKGDEDYYKALEEARKKNKRMGYGGGEKGWSKTEYEAQRAQLLLESKVKNKQ